MSKKCSACGGGGWYDATDKDGNNIPCGACDGTGYEADDENAELKLELIAARSRLVDVEKAFKLICEVMGTYTGACPVDTDTEQGICLEYDCNFAKCWKEYFLWKARGGHETSDIQNRQR